MLSHLRAPKRRRRIRRGAVTVEFAMILPVFLLLTFAAIEFGRLNILRHAIDNATYEATRKAIVPGASADDVIACAENYMINKVGASGATATVTPEPLDETVDVVTVRLELPLDENAWITPTFSAGKTLVSECTLRTERYRGIPIPE